jgi:hypothetical protein
MFELRHFLIFLSFLIYGNLEEYLEITNSSGNMGRHGLFLGFYYKRNTIYFSIGLSVIGWYYYSYILLALGLSICTFSSLKMLREIYIYRYLFE